MSFPTGNAGKAEYQNKENKIPFLANLATVASLALQAHFPKLAEAIQTLPIEKRNDFVFGSFHLFMSPCGVSKLHKDVKDAISFLFVIRMEEGKGGQLEIGGSGKCVDWNVGDAILFKSSKYFHGSRLYTGDPPQRLIGIFIIHQEFLRIHGFSSDEIGFFINYQNTLQYQLQTQPQH